MGNRLATFVRLISSIRATDLWRICLLVSAGFCILLIFSACSDPTAIPVTSLTHDSPNVEPIDSLLVKFRDVRAVSDGRAKSRLRAAGLVNSKQLRLVPGLTRSTLQQGGNLSQTLAKLRADANIDYAEPDYPVKAIAIPNDARFSSLYGLNNTGQLTGAVADADIDAPEAWDIQTGNNVVIAVIDTGVDYQHPDLRANMWLNPGEIANNGIDDDGNGFIDDVNGWDFSGDTNDPMDQNSHGTHVAGTIAAVGNNGIGITGVNWQAKIMALKFMDANGNGTTSGAIRALEYAVANGAKISNNSWGGGTFSQAMFDALQAANATGHLFVSAAGNDQGVNNDLVPHYPSSYNINNIISVTATDNADQLANFSNIGPNTVDLAAPGVALLSTVPNNAYQASSGTSMSAPIVSGVIGLIVSQSPNLSVSDIRSALLDNVDRLSSLAGKVVTGGRVNAFKAVSSLGAAAPLPPVAQPLVITPTNPEVSMGDSEIFTATGGTSPYSWSVNNPIVGTIDEILGSFIARTVGNVEVILMDNIGATATTLVTVTTMNISPSTTTELSINDKLTLTVNGGQGPFQWRVSDSAIASITGNSTGSVVTLTPLAVGRMTVSVTDNRQSTTNTNPINIVLQSTLSLAVDLRDLTLDVGSQQDLTVSGGTAPYQWTTADQTIASFNTDNNIARVFANRAGTTALTVTDTAGASVMVDVQINTITPPPQPVPTLPPTNTPVPGPPPNNPAPTPTSPPISPGPSPEPSPPGQPPSNTPVIVTAAATTVIAGGTIQFTVSGGTSPYNWTLDNNIVASIDNNGLMTTASNILFAVTFTVIATDNNGVQGSVSIDVTLPGAAPGAGTAPAPAGGHGGMGM